MSRPTRATAAGQAYLDLQNLASAADQDEPGRARPSGPSSFVRWALQLDPGGLARSLTGG